MKFTVLHNFKAPGLYEAGNKHDSAAIGLADDQVEMFYRQGWIQIDGRDPAPALDPKRTELVIQSSAHKNKTKEVK